MRCNWIGPGSTGPRGDFPRTSIIVIRENWDVFGSSRCSNEKSREHQDRRQKLAGSSRADLVLVLESFIKTATCNRNLLSLSPHGPKHKEIKHVISPISLLSAGRWVSIKPIEMDQKGAERWAQFPSLCSRFPSSQSRPWTFSRRVLGQEWAN